MSTLLAKIHIHPGKESTFEDVMAYMYEQTHDTEEGVLRYEYWRGREPGFYYCLLSFTDALAFWRHQASDHHEGEMQRFTECIADLDLEVIDPVRQASPLPQTEVGGDVSAEPQAVQAAAGVYAIDVQDWWRALRDS